MKTSTHAWFLLAFVLGGCGDDAGSRADSFGGTGDSESGSASGGGTGASSTAGSGSGGEGGGDSGGLRYDIGEPPPEDEEEADFRIPQASGRFVYSASPETDKVAVIDADSLAIDVVVVGDLPTMVAPIPGGAGATGAVAVLDQGSHELGLLRTASDGDNAIELHPVTPGANNLAVSPDGAVVIVFHDVDGPEQLGPGSDQELSIVEVANGMVHDMTVGPHPSAIEFAPDGNTAYVVTADGVNVIDLGNLDVGLPPLVPVVDPGTDPSLVEVRLATASGQALARVEGERWLDVTDLASGDRRRLTLPAVATDLDIAQSGEYALLVLPRLGGSTLVEVPLPPPVDGGFTTSLVGIEYVGLSQLTPDGEAAILYTTQNPLGSGEGVVHGSDEPERLAATDTDTDATDAGTGDSGTDGGGSESTGEGGSSTTGGGDPEVPDGDPRQRVTIARRAGGAWDDLYTLFSDAPVLSVGVAPTSRNAILLHAAKPELNPKAPWPYTILDFRGATPIRKLQTVETQPGPVLFTPDGERAAVLLRNDAASVRRVDVVHLDNFIVEGLLLGSPPQGLGYVDAAGKIFVSQAHPAGRITFIATDGVVQTVTGFELNDKVKD